MCRSCKLFDPNYVRLYGSDVPIQAQVKTGTFTNRLEFEEYRNDFLLADIQSYQESLQEDNTVLPEPNAEIVFNYNSFLNLMGGNIKKSENNKYKINYD